MRETESRAPWKTLLAFAIIYIVWGSTFLAIRVGVKELPPFLFAALRFLIAGAVLFGWTLARKHKPPTRREWGSISIIALLIFVIDYGLLFWAEQKVPSGIAAVMMATIPAFMALAEILFLRAQRLTLRLATALLIGIAGVAALMSHSLSLHDVAIDNLGAIALLIGAVSWSIASVLSKKLPLPASKITSSGAQMLAGGLMLAMVALARREVTGFHPSAVSCAAWLALAYLVVMGSIVGFTAYVWLIHHESATRVGTYAYVNPVVAVALGYFVAGESISLRTIIGTLCVLMSVIVITTSGSKKIAAAS